MADAVARAPGHLTSLAACPASTNAASVAPRAGGLPMVEIRLWGAADTCEGGMSPPTRTEPGARPPLPPATSVRPFFGEMLSPH